jgi:rhomboid protease GluP
MAHAEPHEVEILLYGAKLVDGGVDDYAEWAEAVTQRFPDHELRSQLRSLFSLSRELRLHPPDNRRQIASQMLAHRRVAGTGSPAQHSATDTPTPAIVMDGPIYQAGGPSFRGTADASSNAVVVGDRGSLVGVVMSGVVCCVIAAVIISGKGNFLVYIVAALIAKSVFSQFQRFFRPPLIGVRNGVFTVRLANTMGTPVENVAQLAMSGGRVGIIFHDAAQVNPPGSRLQIARQYEAAGVHLVIAGGVFSLDDVNRVRQALGLPLQASDESPRGGTDFLSILTAATPHVWVTPAIVLANVIAYLALSAAIGTLAAADSETMARWGGNVRDLTMYDGQWWRLLTSMFLHYGVVHLALNMYVLWHIGSLVERFVGNTAFAISYLVAGIAGSVASVCWSSIAVSAGASGAIFGVFGVLAGFLSLHRKSIPPAAVKQLRNTTLMLLGISLLFGFSVPRIDNAAHIGGLIAGFFCGLLLSQEISPDKFRARRYRTAILAVVGAAFCVAVVFALPSLPVRKPDLRLPLDTLNHLGQRLDTLNRRSIEISNTTWDQLEQGTLSSEAAGQRLETEVVAEHNLLLHDIRKELDSRNRNREEWEPYAEFVRLRIDGWTLMAQAATTKDSRLKNLAVQKLNAANDVLPTNGGK